MSAKFCKLESMKIERAKIRVVALCGSLNNESTTRRALEIALEGAQNQGAQTELIDLRTWKLPFCGQDYDANEFPDVARLQKIFTEAHGLLWGTPEYHGSFSGVLKNALDLMGFDEISGKMVGLVGSAAGSVGALSSLNHLRSVGRQLHAWVLPAQVSIARSYEAFDENGALKDPKIDARLRDLGRDVARFAYLHSIADDEFLSAWENRAA